MKKIITICSSLILGVFCLGCSKDSTTAPTAARFTISIAESENGIVDPHGDFTVQRADSINIKAKNAREGYRFLKWQITNGSNNVSVRDTAGDSTYIADIAGDAEIEAVFVIDTFDIIVTSDEHGNALVEDTFKVAYGEGLDISAGQSSNGYRFSHWVTGSDPNFSIGDNRDSVTSISNVTGDGTITCTFTPLTYTLVVEDPNPVAGGSIQGTAPGTYSHGDEIVLTAEPNLGWKLTGWNGVGETGESIAFNIYADMTISAKFDTISVPEGVICVRHDAPQDGPGELGSNWVNAYQTLQEALDISPEGSEIWVARGSYSRGSENVAYEVKSYTSVYGSFVGNERTLTERDSSDWHEHMSILDGADQTNYIFLLLRVTGVTIDGFIIKDAKKHSVYIRGENNVIRNCIIKGNNTFSLEPEHGNTAISITSDGTNTIIDRCVFYDNRGEGSCVATNAPGVSIVNCLMANNDGPAIVENNTVRDNPTKIICCSIIGNKSRENNPGGIQNVGNIVLRGTILYDNTNPDSLGTQIDTTYIVDACCIMDHATTGVLRKDTSSFERWGFNNTDANPDFISTVLPANDNLFFSKQYQTLFIPQSAAIINMANFIEDKPVYDIRKKTRDDRFEMGCYED